MTGERGGLVDERVVQLARAGTSRQPKRDAERLSPRAAGAQPPRGRSSDTSLELGLACVERVAERRVPGELVARDRVELEQPAQERLRVLAAQVAALDERDCMREIGERQPASEPRPVRTLSRVGRCHELARSAAPETATPPQLLGLGHRGSLALALAAGEAPERRANGAGRLDPGEVPGTLDHVDPGIGDPLGRIRGGAQRHRAP